MAKNISLLGADYPDVPAVQLPQTGGGTATFYDIDVIDSLDSESSTDALSAKQGKVLGDKISNVGTIQNGSNQNATVSVPNETATLATAITLSKGTWLIVACADWASNANGYRQIAMATGKNPGRHLAVTTPSAGGDKETYQQLSRIVEISVETTISIYAMQNSGSSLSVYPYSYAVRII